MLIVKLLEAIVRIFGLVSFDQSRHVVDSGLIGACGLAGCCGGSRKRRRHRNAQSKSSKGKESINSYRKTEANKRLSDASSYMQSLGSPVRPGTGKGSVHSGPPPSVLKPEHALRPYREESDDENGYIMGAWQPFQTKGSRGYVPVEQPSPVSSKPASGFSRVGGGRAHIDTPYAIKAGSTQTFPSIAQHTSQYNASAGSLRRPDDEEDDTPSVSAINAVRHQQQASDDSSLPPGALPPFHIRTKSQTAIIEDAGGILAGPSSYSPTGAAMRPTRRDATPPPTAFNRNSAHDDGSDNDTPKKKPWYHIRRNRPHTSEGTSSPPSIAAPEEEAPLDPKPGRSFVVVRKPQVSPARSQKLSTASAPGLRSANSSSPGPSRQSFPAAGSGPAL